MPSVTRPPHATGTPTADAPRARSRSPRGEGDRLRDDLLDAALGLLSEAGDPEHVSIRAVAKSAGVSATAAYRHFEDRDELIEAACERSFELFSALLFEATVDAADPFERLRLAGEAYVRFAEDNHGLYRALFSNPLHMVKKHLHEPGEPLDLDSAGTQSFGQLVVVVQECLDAGAPAVGPGGVGAADATYLSFQIWSWLHGIVDLRITHAPMGWPDPALMLTDLQRSLGLTRPA